MMGAHQAPTEDAIRPHFSIKLRRVAGAQLGINHHYFAPAAYHAPTIFQSRQQAAAPQFRMGIMLLMEASN
jgi:hypothetical protein